MACCHDNCDHEQRHEDDRDEETHGAAGTAPAGCCGGHGPSGACQEHARHRA